MNSSKFIHCIIYKTYSPIHPLKKRQIISFVLFKVLFDSKHLVLTGCNKPVLYDSSSNLNSPIIYIYMRVK